MKSFVSDQQNLIQNTYFYWQPVEFIQHRNYTLEWKSGSPVLQPCSVYAAGVLCVMLVGSGGMIRDVEVQTSGNQCLDCVLGGIDSQIVADCRHPVHDIAIFLIPAVSTRVRLAKGRWIAVT